MDKFRASNPKVYREQAGHVQKMEGARAFSFGVLVLFFRKGIPPRSALLPFHLLELAHVSTLNKLLAKETKS